VPESELYAVRLNLPIACRFKAAKMAEFVHMIALVQSGESSLAVDMTPYSELLFPPDRPWPEVLSLLQRGKMELIQGDKVAEKLEPAGTTRLTMKYPFAHKSNLDYFMQNVLSARQIGQMVVGSFLGLDIKTGGKILMSFTADCFKRGRTLPLLSLGMLGFTLELDEQTARRIADRIGQDPNNFLKLMLWLSNNRPDDFQEIWCKETVADPVDEYMQGSLSQNLPALRHFLLNIPREAFLSQ